MNINENPLKNHEIVSQKTVASIRFDLMNALI